MLLFYFKSPNAWIDVGKPIPLEVEFVGGREIESEAEALVPFTLSPEIGRAAADGRETSRIERFRRDEEDLMMLFMHEFEGYDD